MDSSTAQTDFHNLLSDHLGIPRGAGTFREMLYSPVRHFVTNNRTSDLTKSLTAVPMAEAAVGALKTWVARYGNSVCYTKPEAM